jgi:hypothetical protein
VTLRRNKHLELALGLVFGLALLPACANQANSTESGSHEPGAKHASSTDFRAQPKPLSPEERAFSESAQARIDATQKVVGDAAEEHELDPSLINAMIWVESRFQPKAKSKAGARGLMQLMPATAASLATQMGERRARSYDPEFNVRAGSLYLAKLIDKFDDEAIAVAAYHAGPGNVGKWLAAGTAFPDYSQKYVDAVFTARQRFANSPRPSGTDSPAAAPVIETAFEAEPAPELEAPQEKVIESDSAPEEVPEPMPVEDAEPYFREAQELDPQTGPPAKGFGEPLPQAPAPVSSPRTEVGIGILPDV